MRQFIAWFWRVFLLFFTEYETLQVGQDIVKHVTFDQTMKEKINREPWYGLKLDLCASSPSFANKNLGRWFHWWDK